MENLTINTAKENDGRRTKEFDITVKVANDQVTLGGYIGDSYGKQSAKHLRIETITGSPEARDIVAPLAYIARYEARIIELIEEFIHTKS